MRRRVQSVASTVLLIASVALLIGVGFLYLRDRDNSKEPTPPTAVPGHNQAIDVLEAFRSAGLTAKFGEQGTGVHSEILEGTGQALTLKSGQAYVFLYQDVATQEAATLDVLPEDIDLVDVAGDDVSFTTINLYTNSNVAVVLVNANAKTADQVETAVAALT
jgi:hypothetical protein